jgi:transcriptional regulator with XRE-family HTH domain
MSKLYATKLLKEWREAREWTQPEFVGLFNIETGLDISFSAYQKWENGQLNLAPDRALELSRFTRIDLKDLLERR